MFEVGDKVRYVPNRTSPSGQGAEEYNAVIGSVGTVSQVNPNAVSYPYRVWDLLFSEAELVKVA